MQERLDRIKELNTLHWNFFKKYLAMDLKSDDAWEEMIKEIDKIIKETELQHRDYIKRLLLADAELLNDIRKFENEHLG